MAMLPIISFLLGNVFGAQHSVMRALLSEIAPGGSEVEFMGLLNTCGALLGWSGPLLFIVFNEVMDINVALLSLGILYLFAAVSLSFIDMGEAHNLVLATMDKRRKSIATPMQELERPEGRGHDADKTAAVN